MKTRSNQRAANRGDGLARAALVCGIGSKNCPPERATGPVRLVSAPSVDNWLAVQVLLILLCVAAGSADAIGFLGLGGLFIALCVPKTYARA